MLKLLIPMVTVFGGGALGICLGLDRVMRVDPHGGLVPK